MSCSPRGPSAADPGPLGRVQAAGAAGRRAELFPLCAAQPRRLPSARPRRPAWTTGATAPVATPHGPLPPPPPVLASAPPPPRSRRASPRRPSVPALRAVWPATPPRSGCPAPTGRVPAAVSGARPGLCAAAVAWEACRRPPRCPAVPAVSSEWRGRSLKESHVLG